MTVTISDGTTTVTPRLMLGYEGTRDARSIVHDVLGTADPYVTLRPSATETATLSLLFDDANDAQAAVVLLGSGQRLTLTVDDIPTLDMALVVRGPVSRTLDDQTLTRWIVAADVQAVP